MKVSRKHVSLAIVAMASMLVIVIATLRRPTVKNLYVGMTVDEARRGLQQPVTLLHGPPKSEGSGEPANKREIGFIIRSGDGLSLYFDREEKLLAVYQKPWYSPLPLRRWLHLGPAKPVIGTDPYDTR